MEHFVVGMFLFCIVAIYDYSFCQLGVVYVCECILS